MDEKELIRLRQWAVAQATCTSWVGFPGGIDSCALTVVHLIAAHDELKRTIDSILNVPVLQQVS